MKGDFFYSKSTGLYVSRKPLAINSRTGKAAARSGIKIDWDDEGRIIYSDFDDAKKLTETLGSRILNPREYWKVLEDAKVEKDANMVNELLSDRYAEWLDRTYLRDGTFIDNPRVIGQYRYDGLKTKSEAPNGTPGWFNPEGNVNERTGEPIKVEINREKFATSWKYWSPNLGLSATARDATAPIRGYVTSVGKPSFDMGIPVDSRQPKLMVRECRYELIIPVIDPKVADQAEKVKGKNVIPFLNKNGELFRTSDSFVYKSRERFFDMLGDLALKEDVKEVASKLYEKDATISYNDFSDFITSSKKRMRDANKERKDIVFVMGHKNPDTDTAVSTMFESWRNHLINGDEVAYIPVVQSSRNPDEVTRLIGELSGHTIFTNDPMYEKIKKGGLARWISVDQNRDSEVQKYFVAMIDHHVASEYAKNVDIPKTLEMTGSCSALVTRKYLGMGLDVPKKLARILYGATLMDTENRAQHKMTERDVKIMDYLKRKSEVKDDGIFYSDLMSNLLNTNDSELLFRRDYKEDWGFGFAVTKIKNGFSEDGKVLKEELVKKLCTMATKNNEEKNLPLTLLKITDYKDDNETVNRERMYLFFKEGASENFRNTMYETVNDIIKFEFSDDVIEHPDNKYIDFHGSGMQLSRKKTAPILQPIAKSFNDYFYSPPIRKWVKRDFLKYTKDVKDVAKDLSTDSQNRVNYITFKEAKELTFKLGIDMLSLNEYWKVLNDAKKIKDAQMIESLQGSNFVEFLDSAIIDKKYLIDHPTVGESISGEKKAVTVPKGNPGLIHPNDIDLETGIPKVVRSPNEYGNKDLWRYWEPDSRNVLPCRSYIFLLDQPCWDGKFHITDNFPNLGLRPVVKNVKEPDVKIKWDKDFLFVSILSEGEIHLYKWPKKISDFLNIE